jgi:phage tail tape-measure protein
MDGSSIEKLRDELARLMQERIESMKNRTFLGITPEELRREKEQLQRIREVSADFLEALKRISR